MTDASALTELHIVPAPARQVNWFTAPEHMTETRVELLAVEYGKIDTYGQRGDVASYQKGLDYIQSWEVTP